MRNRWISITLITLFLVMFIGLTSSCAVLPTSPERAILGKWQTPELGERPHGGSLDPSLWEKFKEASGSQTFTLEFFKDGQVLYSSKTGIIAGTYRLIGDKHIEITWDSWHVAYEVQISGDRMTLERGEESTTFRRVH